MTGELSVEDLDDEELMRGQIRNKNGTFGKPPLVVPRSFLTRLAAEMQARVEAELRGDLPAMYAVMREQALNPKTRPDVRHESAKYIIERVTGKIPDKSIVQQQITIWDNLLAGQDSAELIVDLPPAELPKAVDNVVDAEIVEDTPVAPPQPERRVAKKAQPAQRRRRSA